MTEEAQRIAIAEACGIKPSHAQRLQDGKTILIYLSDGKWLPDYLHDLNAMAKAEAFGEDDLGEYLENLAIICGREPRCSELATAAQRAEAFLRTMGKWTE